MNITANGHDYARPTATESQAAPAPRQSRTPKISSGTASAGKYLYAISALKQDRVYEVVGLDRSAVYAVTNGRVAAIVSDCGYQKIRPLRAHVVAHREVLKHLMLESTVLPMAFGMVADDARAVRRLLNLNQQEFVDQLARVAGKIEMGVRITWDVPNIFDYFVALHPDLRAARDRLLARGATHEDRIELGRLFDRVLNAERDAQASKVEQALAGYCAEIKRAAPRDLKEVSNLNLLISRDRQAELEQAVLDAARNFDNSFAFDLNGPWAPHDFVDLNVKLDGRK